MIADAAAYRQGRRTTTGLEEAAADADADLLWVGLVDPDDAELATVGGRLGLTDDVAALIAQRHHRARLRRPTPDVVVATVVPAQLRTDGSVELGELALVVTDRVVLTVRRGAPARLTPVRAALEKDTARLSGGADAVLAAVLEAVMRAYADVAADLDERIGDVEDDVFADDRRALAETIHTLRRATVELRRAVLPLADQLADHLAASVAHAELLRPVLEHAERLAERLEMLDTLVGSVFDAYIAQVGLRQNDDMRRISAWAGLAAIPTVLAGVYGMNFDNMPELHTRYGYFVVLAVMIGSAAFLYRRFRRAGWL